jgi:hypothetical protein
VNIKSSDLFDGVFIECPHCKVCSIRLSKEEYAIVKLGQYMINVCQVCGKEVYINGG